MISNKMQAEINRQINAELWSAYLYLAMSLDAESKALQGAANWFFVQWLEEQDHSRILQNYLNDRGAKVVLSPIESVPNKWKSLLDMLEDALVQERKVTEMINRIYSLAYEEDDFATMSRMQWFIDEQVEEEKSVTDAINTLRDMPVYYFDQIMAERKYSQASPLKKDDDSKE